MDKKEILKWVAISVVVFIGMLFTFPITSIHCDKSQDVCRITTRSIFEDKNSEKRVAEFNISKIKKVEVRKQGNSYYPVLVDKRGEWYKLEAFPTKTMEGSQNIIDHMLNDDKYDLEGSFFKIINKSY